MSKINKKEVLTIYVKVTEVLEVKGKTGEVGMVFFGGRVDCDNFKGIILPGGIDTQKEFYGENRVLSARYILDGTDKAGEECKIFIENIGIANDSGQVETTTPQIITDSYFLSFLETSKLEGVIELADPVDEGIIIRIYTCD